MRTVHKGQIDGTDFEGNILKKYVKSCSVKTEEGEAADFEGNIISKFIKSCLVKTEEEAVGLEGNILKKYATSC